MKIVVTLLRLLYFPMKLRKTKNRICIISRQSREASLDIRLIEDYIAENFSDVECRVMVKFIEPGLAAKIGYAFHMISQMWAMAASKVVLLDGYCITASVLRHKESLRIVQMWHALAAIKQFGYQTLDKEGGHSSRTAEVMCMHRNYDYVLASGPRTAEHFCRGFNVSMDRIKFLGMPRIDEIVKARKDADESAAFRDEVRREYGVAEGQEIVLYVPTFRNKAHVDVKSLSDAVDDSRFRLIVKLHPLDDEEGISDKRYSTYEWMKACDRIITDYSALGVEATLTGKPLYFYVYDIDEYEKKTGLNVNPLTEMPKASVGTAGEMAELLSGEYDFDELESFRNRYISVDTHNCTKQLGDFLYGIIKETF